MIPPAHKAHQTTDGLFNGLLCKAVSTSAAFVRQDALPDCFLSATDPVSRNRCTKHVIVDAFGAVVNRYFCDEAHFWLNGYVNKQNCRIWSEANPQVYVETPLHPEKLTVWCTLWAGGILLQKR
ncbi:hypothetical protein TNCV_4333601 [Trichonephila clavipes]|nr:hypothetical protein TNCV_4333601 [Trichonephila clavipes]